MKEIWKDIKDYKGLYQVSNLGRVKALEKYVTRRKCGIKHFTEIIMKPASDKDGYLSVTFNVHNKAKTFKVHRLVAEAFIPNPNNYPQVNHKDENKANNNVENLEWCTAKYNLDYNDLQKRNHIKQKRKIAALSIDNNIIKEFDSASDAANYIYNIGAAVNIRSAVCNIVAAANTLQSKLRYGYIWR